MQLFLKLDSKNFFRVLLLKALALIREACWGNTLTKSKMNLIEITVSFLLSSIATYIALVLTDEKELSYMHISMVSGLVFAVVIYKSHSIKVHEEKQIKWQDRKYHYS